MRLLLKATLICGLFGQALAGIASAEKPYLSPDGRSIAFVDDLNDAEYARRQIRVIDADCVFEGKPREACKRIVFESGVFTNGKIVWAQDSSSFIRSGRDRLWFTKISGAGAQPTRYWGELPIDPLVFDPATFPGRDERPTEPVDGDIWERKISNARGDLVGEIVENGNDTSIRIPGGPEFQIPHEIVWKAFFAPSKYQVGASAHTADVFFWSSSMGPNGLLQRIGPTGVEAIRLPNGIFGLASPVWDVATSEPIAILDPFALHPLERHEGELAWLDRSMQTLRSTEPSLEFSAVSVTLQGRTAVVQAVQGLTCVMTYVVRPERTQFADRSCSKSSKDLGAPSVSPVEIAANGYALKGRLYSWAASRPAAGLLVVFQGGPHANSVQTRPWIAGAALSHRFDILVVDYRGSIGFGWDNLTALRQPLSDVAAQDLRAVTAWSKVSAYSNKPLGFWGDSWGGYAGLLALTRGIGGLDFIVSNSGFVERSDEKRAKTCSEAGIGALLFGITKKPGGGCVENDAQLMKETVSSSTPLLMLVGEKDRQTEPAVSHQWAAAAKVDGACLTVITSIEGGHTLQWPEASRNAALAGLRDWVDDVLAGRPEACGSETSLP